MSLTDLTVLLVDDDRPMRRLISRILRELNCQTIVEADNGKDALEIMGDRAFDLLIFDWRMDPIDGLQLTKTVRQSKKNPNQKKPILVLTAYAEEQNVRAAISAGATSFVAKPVSFKGLSDRIALALRHTTPAKAEKSDTAE